MQTLTMVNIKDAYEKLNFPSRIILKTAFAENFKVSLRTFERRLQNDSFDFVERKWVNDWLFSNGYEQTQQPDTAESGEWAGFFIYMQSFMKPVLKGFTVVARETLEHEFGQVCDPTVSHWLLMQILIDSEPRRVYRRISLN